LKLKDVDTLFLRIFLLLLIAFVLSSLLAFGVFQAAAPSRMGGPFEQRHPAPAGASQAIVGGSEFDSVPDFERRLPPPHPPWILIGVDAMIKVIAGALAAWIAARALSTPMTRLSDAARELGKSLSPTAGVGIAVAPPQLDEEGGTREVRETAHVFNELARQLKTDFDTQRLMLATVSHDLRTPLTRLRMRLSELEDHPAARSAIDDVHQMDELIESLLALFRPTLAPAAGASTRLDAFALVQAIVDDLPDMGAAVTLHGETAATSCQPAAFRRMVENLIENAIRHGGQAGPIDVEVTRNATQVCVIVADRGPGLSEEQLATAGTPFLRWSGAERDQERRAGLGLGLYITRALAEREKGNLSLTARPGGGLCATLHLPLSA
jgi:signal transduction histidine kinase